MRVAFQGVRGAYSEEAALAHFGPACEAQGFPFSSQVFEMIGSGAVKAGILPIENSIAGAVAENLDLLLAEDVFIVAESYLAIRHCLLAQPRVALEEVRTVISHPVALAQCRDFIARNLFRAIPEYDTAGAAKMVSERHAPGEAAIASKGCAAVYGLKVLAENIQSVRENITRFAIFVRGNEPPAGLKMEKTTVAFRTRHRAGALLDCLRRFAEHRINLTRLESRPVAENPFEYTFFVDLLGGLRDKRVRCALDELSEEARRVKILGSYPIAP